MKKFVQASMIILFMWFSHAEKASSQIVADWHFYDDAIALLSTTNPQTPANGRITGIFISFDTSISGCRPILSLMSFSGLVLGQVTKPRAMVSSSNKNRMVVQVGPRRFIPVTETVINEYSNGTEVVAMFDVELVTALLNPTEISISFGDGQAVFSIRAISSLDRHLNAARAACTG